MTFYVATLGELFIAVTLVLVIWFRVLFTGISTPNTAYETNTTRKKLLFTSVGLVVTSAAFLGIVCTRLAEWYYGREFYISVTAFFMTMIAGYFMFIISASIDSKTNHVRSFALLTLLWTILYVSISLMN